MAKILKNNFGYLGADYQYKLVSAFIDDHKYFKMLYPIIDQNAFTEPCLRGVVGVMKDYYQEYEICPSYDIILFEVRQKLVRTEDDEQYYDETLERLKKTSTEGRESVTDLGFRFFKQQSIIRAANKILQIASDGDVEKYDDCSKILEDIVSVNFNDDDTSSPMESIEEDMSKENVISIPTGISKLDDALGGGLDKGKIGIIIGSSGFGKTSMTTCMAGNAATTLNEKNNFEGFKVLQIVFEDTHRDMHRKYFSKIAQVETSRLNESEETEITVKRILRNSPETELINNNIRIVRLPSGEKNVSDIKALIKRKINEGFKPDMIIIDYFECLAPEPGMSKMDITEREGKSMRKIENLAPELDVAIWVTTQGNRESFTSEVVTMDKTGGSIKKVQIAQVVLSIARTVDQQKENRATITLLKHRGGSLDAKLENIIFNNGTCTIDCSEAIDFDDVMEYNEYATEKEKSIQKDMIKEARAAFKLQKN